MRYLLDTHSLLWSAFSPRKLGKAGRAAILEPDNDILVSVVSFWEISLKYALGKIGLEGVSPEQLPGVAEDMGFAFLALAADAASSFHKLPVLRHKDPFDRMLIWQAIGEGLPIITKDPDFALYAGQGLKVIW